MEITPTTKETGMQIGTLTISDNYSLDAWVAHYTKDWARGDMTAIHRLAHEWLMPKSEAYSRILAMALKAELITPAQHER
jgi:hypothetical protein